MKTLFYIIFILTCFSCINQEKNYTSVELVLSNESVKLQISEDVETNIKTFFVYRNDSVNYYLFQNERTNEILFYDIRSKKIAKKVKFQQEGPNGVGQFIGFYPLSSSRFILTRSDLCELYIVNDSGNIEKRIRYEKNENDDSLIPCVSATGAIGPIAIVNDKIYHSQLLNPYFGEEILNKSPVSIAIDSITCEITTLALRFPSIRQVSDILNHQISMSDFNVYRCFTGKQFVYSFSFDEDIYVTSIPHDTIKKIKAKSLYIKKLQPIRSGITDYKTALKCIAETAMYRNILYDPYRDVYYRFVYLQNELSENENFSDQLKYGHSLFSVLILDKDFNVIGETLFPEHIYNPTLAFVDEDGFYISDSHYKNPDYDENTLSFKKFILHPIK